MTLPSIQQRVNRKLVVRADADRWHRYELDAELEAFNALTQPQETR